MIAKDCHEPCGPRNDNKNGRQRGRFLFIGFVGKAAAFFPGFALSE